MKKQKILVLLFTFLNFNFFSKTVTFQNDNYSGTITYNEKIQRGDAIVARMNLKISKNSKRKNNSELVAALHLLKDDKKIDSAQFYLISKKSSNNQMIATIPVTLWTDENSAYSLKVIFKTNEITAKETTLPLIIQEKEFISEVLNLNEANSNIKQNMSAERMAQIEKLNNILKTVNTKNVYTLKPFVRPVKSERMTAYYGDKRTYKYTNGKSEISYHYGNDYGVPEKTEVFACAEGKVVMAEFRISTGWSIVIEHLPGLYSLYYHLSSLNVKENDYVKQNQLIGLSGSTGLATGPHLHWEVRLNMAAVNPDFFTKDFAFETSD